MDRATSHIILSTKALCVTAIVFLFPVPYHYLLAAACPSTFQRLQWLQCAASVLCSAPPAASQISPGDNWTAANWLCMVREIHWRYANIRHLNSYYISYTPPPPFRKDVYTNAEYIQEGLQIEQASVLYNICKCYSDELITLLSFC